MEHTLSTLPRRSQRGDSFYSKARVDLPTREFQCKGVADQSLNTAFDLYQSFEAIQMHLKTSNRVTCDLMVP